MNICSKLQQVIKVACAMLNLGSLQTLTSNAVLNSICHTLTTIPYQMQSSSSGLRKANLPATWFMFFKWLISLLVIGKMCYNGGMGWWPYLENDPPTSNRIFWCSEIFSSDSTPQLRFRNTREVAVQMK